MQADGIDRRDAHVVRWVHRAACGFPLRARVALHDLAAAAVVARPFRGKHERPLGSVDQLDAEMRLQLIDDLARAGLRNPVFVGSARKATPPDDITKHFERLDVHRRGNQTRISRDDNVAALYLWKEYETNIRPETKSMIRLSDFPGIGCRSIVGVNPIAFAKSLLAQRRLPTRPAA